MKDTVKNLLVFLITCILLFVGTESFLRYEKINASHTERIGLHHYQSIYTNTMSAYPVYHANEKLTLAQNEYTRVISANSFGFNDYEWQRQKTDSCRVIALGDSFTEGAGSSNDSSYVQQLRKLLPNTQIFCAGISGCDPVFSYKMLTDSLMPYFHPDIITVDINATDIGDIRIRGGMERFTGSKTITTKHAPKWEWLYARSYCVRFFVHQIMRYDWYLVSKQQAKHDTREAIETLKNVMDNFVDWGNRNHVQVIFIFHPLYQEIISGENQCAVLIEYAHSKKYKYVDAYDYFAKHNVTEQTALQYFWENDSHCNNAGYSLLANAIAQKWQSL